MGQPLAWYTLAVRRKDGEPCSGSPVVLLVEIVTHVVRPGADRRNRVLELRFCASERSTPVSDLVRIIDVYPLSVRRVGDVLVIRHDDYP